MGDRRHVSSIPEGVSGDWSVEKFTVNEQEASLERIRSIFSSQRGRGVPSGSYTRLCHKRSVIMSDTPDEISDHLYAVRMARGHVLINGLGLGVVACMCLDKPEVTKVTVIENSADVISLVAPTLLKRYGDIRLQIIHADAFNYKPPRGIRYGMVWHDIWPSICSDNLDEMKKLHRKYGRRSNWQGSWARELCSRR